MQTTLTKNQPPPRRVLACLRGGGSVFRMDASMKLIPVWTSQKAGRGEVVAYMKCDDRDFNDLNGVKWRLAEVGRCKYATFSVSSKERLFAHRSVVTKHVRRPINGEDTDHINGDGLDNRLENLRIIPHRQNIQNQRTTNRKSESGYRGVYFIASKNVYAAYAGTGKDREYNGYAHKTAEAANEAAIALRKRLGFLDSTPTPQRSEE